MNDYDPWGVVLDQISFVNNQNKVNNFDYSNRERQTEFGLNVMALGARMFDPNIGRFWSVDPITDEQENYSPYQYGWNNPVLRSDPNGELPILAWLDAVVDVGFVAYDAAVLIHEKITTGKTSTENWAALAADGASIVIPMSVGAGMAVKATMKAAKKIDKAVEVAKTADKVKDAEKVVAKADEVKKVTTKGKRNFSRKDRAEGYEKSKDATGKAKCEYCDSELDPEKGKPNSYETDHRDPYSKGGQSNQNNLAPTCRDCNRSKSNKELNKD